MNNKKIILLLSSLLSPLALADDAIDYSKYRAANTPVNYSFINLEVGNKSYDNLDNSMIVGRVSGQTLLNDAFIFKMGFQAEFLDESNNVDKISYQDNLANIGVGWRYPIFKATDVELDGDLLYNWNDDTINSDGSIETDIKKSEMGYRVGAAVHHGFGDSFDVKFGLNYRSIDQFDQTSLDLSLTKYITRYVGVGINGYIANGDDKLGDLNYIALHLNLAFY
ncbi:MAG: outer membrane beta-barrel protein [Psychromonas sp.]